MSKLSLSFFRSEKGIDEKNFLKFLAKDFNSYFEKSINHVTVNPLVGSLVDRFVSRLVGWSVGWLVG